MDTDGSFIADNRIEIDEEQEKPTIYTTETIKVYSSQQKENIIQRNNERIKNIKSMNTQEKIVNEKYKYQLYYFSRHIEHVIFDEPNPTGDKVNDMEKFLNNLTMPIEDFLENYLPSVNGLDYKEKYSESWKYIEKDANSLKRCTNVPYLFEYMDQQIDEVDGNS